MTAQIYWDTSILYINILFVKKTNNYTCGLDLLILSNNIDKLSLIFLKLRKDYYYKCMVNKISYIDYSNNLISDYHFYILRE